MVRLIWSILLFSEIVKYFVNPILKRELWLKYYPVNIRLYNFIAIQGILVKSGVASFIDKLRNGFIAQYLIIFLAFLLADINAVYLLLSGSHRAKASSRDMNKRRVY